MRNSVYFLRGIFAYKSLPKKGGKTYIIDEKAPLYMKGRAAYYLVDADTNKQIATKLTETGSDPKVLNTIMQAKILSDIVKGVERAESQSKFQIALMLVFSFLLGFLLSYSIFAKAPTSEVIVP